MHLDGRGGQSLRVELGRGRLEAALLQRERIAIGVDVVRQDVDGHHTVRAGQHRVGDGDRVLVQRGRGRDGDAHASGGTPALAVLDRVGEGVGARGILVRRVVDPGGADSRIAQLRGRAEATQGHGVAVGVDTVQGHGDAGGLSRSRPGCNVARTRLLVLIGDAHHLEGNGARCAVARGVDDRVGHVHEAGGLPSLEAHLVARDERGSQGGAGIVFEGRLDLEVQAGGRAIVRQDRHGSHVADAHLHVVGLEDGRQVRAVRRSGDDHHVGRGLADAVGHGVAELHRTLEASGRGNAQQVAINEGHLNLRGVRGIHGGDRQQAAGGVVVVIQGRNEDGAALRQDRRVVFGNGRLTRRRRDLDANDAQCRRDAVGHGVGKGVGTRLGRPKVNGSAVQVRLDRGTGGRTGHGRQGQLVAVRVGVVLQRIEGDGLARVRLEEVAVRRRRQVSGLLNVDDQLTAGLRALVISDRENDRLRAGRAALLGDGDGAVLGEGDLQPLGGLGVLQVDGVAVGIAPVTQGLVLDLGTRADLDGRDAQLRGPLVLIEGVDGDAHVRLG